MALQQRIESLRAKHEHLDLRLREEEMRPMPDDGLIRRIKHEKLKLKDEMARLNHH